MKWTTELLWGFLLILAVCVRLHFWKIEQVRAWTNCSILLAEERERSRKEPFRVRMWNDSVRTGSGRIKNYATFGLASKLSVDVEDRTEELGRRLEWEGEMRCRVPLRNFSESFLKTDEIARPSFQWKAKGLYRKVETGSAPFLYRIHSRLLGYVDQSLGTYPQLRGLVLAVWTGSLEGLSKGMQDVYRDGGLLHLLAISGQHVAIGVLLVLLGFRGVARYLTFSPRLRKIYSYCVLGLPSLVALALSFTSLGSPSILRTLAMALSLLLLRLRRFRATMLQELCSSVGVLILISPDLLLSPGFILSVGATYLLLQLEVHGMAKSSFKKYVLIGILMPILMIPISIFYFGKFSWISVFSSLCLAWSWELFWIPIGFVLPLVGLIPRCVVYSLLEGVQALWNFFEDLHFWIEPYVRSSVCSAVKFSALEVLLIELICLLVILRVARCVSNDAPRIDFFRQKVSNN